LTAKKKFRILYVMEEEEKNPEKIAHDIDTSRFIIKQKLKLDTVRNYKSIITITEKERKQYFLSGSEPNNNAILAEKARNALKIVEMHAKEEAFERERSAKKKTVRPNKTSAELTEEIKNGDFEYGFGVLIEGSQNLKENI